MKHTITLPYIIEPKPVNWDHVLDRTHAILKRLSWAAMMVLIMILVGDVYACHRADQGKQRTIELLRGK